VTYRSTTPGRRTNDAREEVLLMCLGLPGQIVEIVDPVNKIAKADVAGVRRNVSIALLEPEGVQVGDWVLIHVGFAMSKIDEEDARQTYQYLEQLGREFEDELDAIAGSEIE
jgi:hydrogenase expression/formation protein HypC